MTYGELSKIKTMGFTLNHVIDDEVSNARWAYGKSKWESETVPEYLLTRIRYWAARENVEFSDGTVSA